MELQKIPLTALAGVQIGHAQDEAAATGCTVFLLGAEGAPAGLDVRGGGPASRESELLKPLAAAGAIHAILLSGGSAFGLDAAGGVMRYLEENGIGFDTGYARVPLVCQADLYDLSLGSAAVRPDAAMAYAACQDAARSTWRGGNVGAGAGASVGKPCGMERAMKSGIGACAFQLGALQVAAVVAVNALGDVIDPATGRRVAGLRDADGQFRPDSPGAEAALLASTAVTENRFVSNTTLGVVLTNAQFDKTALCKIAGMAQDGLARAICPVHTSADGDTVYAVSLGQVAADRDVVGTLATRAVEGAILDAVRVPGANGLPGIQDA